MIDLDKINQMPEAERQQAKLDLLCEIMQGESSNFAAGIYVPFLAGFCIAVLNTGLDPIETIIKISHHTRIEIKRLLKEQGITTKLPAGAKAN